jgi:hypothetical protein
VTVTAASGLKKVYGLTVVVAKSSNTKLSVLTVNGFDASSGSVVLPARSSSAVVKAVAVDPEAVVVVSGTGLVEGANTVTVKVTAPNGLVSSYPVSVYVTPLSTNTGLAVFTVNGSAVQDGDVVSVANKTASVAVVAVAADADAVVSVAGASGLKTGENQLVVTVTAASGLKKVYGLTVVVAKSSNTKLSVLTVNGNPVNGGDEITLPARTTSAVVKAVAEDPEAKILTFGASDLVAGYNYASVTVIAPDRSVSTIWWFFKVLELSSDNSLSSIQVDGASYANETVVELPLGTSQVAVSAIANDSGAKVAVSGNTNLVGGLNTITVSVTAANGDVKKYEAYVNVPVRSGNAEISSAAGSWLINGIDVSNQDTVVDLPAGTSAITASAKTADSKATMAITGVTKLIAGVNTVTFTVTAENGTQKTYTRYVNVKALSGNANLKYITLAGQNVVGGSQVLVPAGTSRVEVIPVLESDEARFTVAGNTNLVQGSNTVTVVVTAPNGTTSTSTITVVVATPPSDTTLKTFTVNGKAVSAGDVFVVAAGTSRVSVSAIANDSKASVTISGKSSLKAGDNLLIVKVTALSGDSTTYAVTLRVGK